MKRKISVILALLVLLGMFHPAAQKAAAVAAEKIATVIISGQYDLEITEPVLVEEQGGKGTFRANTTFAETAAGKQLRVAVVFYLANGQMAECWSALHTLNEGAEIVVQGSLPAYDSVGVYFFEADSLTPIRPRVFRMLDGQVEVTAGDLAALKQELMLQLEEQQEDLNLLEERLAVLEEELTLMKEQTGEECGAELWAADFGILPGKVEMERMNALLKLACEQSKTIRFDSGIYEFTDTICVESNTSMVGSSNTVLKLHEESTATTLMSVGDGADNVYLAHITLQGNQTERPAEMGAQIGLAVKGAARVNVENVEIAGFDRYGFYGANMTSTGVGEFYKGLQITNCRFYNNYYGMCLGPRCEYSQVLNCMFGDNYVGCLNQGGNNAYVGCMFNANHIGFRMDSKNLSNPAHGGCNGCAFNHNDKAIIVNDCTIGWLFNGCQIFYGSVELNQSSGVVFDSCIFGSCVLHSTHATMKDANLISDSFFQTSSTAILAGNDGSTAVVNCLPDHLSAEEEATEDSRERLLYTQDATVASGASVLAYFAPLTYQISANTTIGDLDIAVQGATAEGQPILDVDVWVGNGLTGAVTEQLVAGEEMTTVWSPELRQYVLRVAVNRVFDYPVFFAMEAERTEGRGIAYGHSGSAINHFNGEGIAVGDVLSANSTYIPEFAVYAANSAPS